MLYNYYFKTYFFHEVVIQVLLYFFPKPHRCPIKNPLNLVIFPLTDFPTVVTRCKIINHSFSHYYIGKNTWLRQGYTCIMSSISRRTSSAVFSGSSGLWVSVLLDKIKACMSKSVATASSSLLKSSSSGLQRTKNENIEFTNVRPDVRKWEAKSENLFLKMYNRCIYIYKVNFPRIIILVTNNQMCKKQTYLPFRRSGYFVQIQSGHMHFPCVGFAPVDGQYIPESSGDRPPHPVKNTMLNIYSY